MVQDTTPYLRHATVAALKVTQILQAASGWLRPTHLANDIKVLSPSVSRPVLITLAASTVLWSIHEGVASATYAWSAALLDSC